MTDYINDSNSENIKEIDLNEDNLAIEDIKSKNSKQKIALIVFFAIVLCLFAYRIISSVLTDKNQASDSTINIKVTEVVRENIQNSSPIIGRIAAVEEVSIIPKFPGEVKNVYVSMGDKVKKGDLLFTMDDTQMQSSYSQANEVYLNAKLNYDRINALYSEGAVSKQQLEQVQLQYETSKQSMLMAADGLSNSKVVSPISGYVTSMNAVVGGIASQAMPAASISNISQVQIKASVSENLINKINVNDKVKVLVSSVQAAPFIGTITALSPAPAVGTLTYPLIVVIDNSDISIKPGMSAEIMITSGKAEAALVVPSSSVMIRNGKTVAAVYRADGKISIVDVLSGIDNGIFVEVKSGLKLGDKVVTTGQQYLNNDSIVKLQE